MAEQLPCVRSRGRSRDRARRDRAVHDLGRCRPRDQSDDRGRPGARRHRAGGRPGAAGARASTTPKRPAPHRLVDGLLPAARRRPAGLRHHTDESQPCKINPLGAKGVGELGTVGGTPTVINAIVDALRPLGVTTSRCRRRPSACGGRCGRRAAEPRERARSDGRRWTLTGPAVQAAHWMNGKAPPPTAPSSSGFSSSNAASGSAGSSQRPSGLVSLMIPPLTGVDRAAPRFNGAAIF